MPLESLGKEGKLNIKRIETPEPKKEVENFDAREVLDEDRQEEILLELHEWKEIVDKNPDSVDIRHFTEGACYFLQLFPEKRQLLSKIDDSVFEHMKRALPAERKANDQDSMAKLASEAQILFPNKAIGELGMTEADVDKIGQEIVSFTASNRDQGFYPDLHALVAVYEALPELVSELQFSEEVYNHLTGLLKNERFWDGIENNYVALASGIRLLFPDRYKDLSAMLNKKRLEYDPAKEADARDYLEYLFHRQILAAQRVAITPRGLEFTMPEKVGEFQVTEPIPETKR